MFPTWLRIAELQHIAKWQRRKIRVMKSLTYWVGISVGILEQSVGTRNRVEIGLSYRPARLRRLTKAIPGLLSAVEGDGGIDSLLSKTTLFPRACCICRPFKGPRNRFPAWRTGARICKRLRRPGIDSNESIPPAYVPLAGRYIK